MKVACLLLSRNRVELIEKVIAKNFHFDKPDVFLLDSGSTTENYNHICQMYPFYMVRHYAAPKGIAYMLNDGIDLTREYDFVATMANDILMPYGWMKDLVRYHKGIPKSGIVGMHTVEELPPAKEVHGVTIHPAGAGVFGNVMLSRAVIDKVGYFNERLDPYSYQDADYNYRAELAGFLNYYLPGRMADHIGHDVGERSEYREMKDEGLRQNKLTHARLLEYYLRTGNYQIKIRP